MKKVEFKGLEEIQTLKMAWQRLEKGKDMTYFQTYTWYHMLSQIYSYNNYHFEISVVVVYNEGVEVLIAPLLIYRHTYRFINKKGIYLWGRKGWSDYLNLVYDKLDDNCLDFFFEGLKSRYGINSFYFEQVKVDTFLYSYLSRKNMIQKESELVCVKFDIPDTVDDYQKLLSKHSRQNIRTAKNRAEKAGVSFSFNYDDQTVDKIVCKEMRDARVKDKRLRKYNSNSFLNKMKIKIKEKFEDRYPDYLPFYDDKNSKMLTVYDGKTLCGFFNYGIDKHHKTIVLMAVGTNDNYARYSPGMLALYSFICSNIEEGDIRCLDFTRGDEPYKLALGGSSFITRNLILSRE